MTVRQQKGRSEALRLMLRQASGRYVTKFSLNGREKRRTRALPSLPTLSFLAVPGGAAEPQKQNDRRC